MSREINIGLKASKGLQLINQLIPMTVARFRTISININNYISTDFDDVFDGVILQPLYSELVF